MKINYGSLPFQQQIDFFNAKTPIPTERWNDLQRDAHDTGFMVAGALKADLLTDLHEAMSKAHELGVTLRDFRKDFANIVEKHGWTGWTGSDSDAGFAWRTRVIYETNLRTSYQAGRWQQIQDGKKHRPYLMYKHSHAVLSPRAEHVAWDGLVVAIDSDWVKTHYPPNGYGCKCTMFALSERDLQKMGKSGPDTPPDDGTYDWVDKKTGEIHTFPNGIQPFWDYVPGASLAGRAKAAVEQKIKTLPEAIGKQLASVLGTAIVQPQNLDEFIAAGSQKTDHILSLAGEDQDAFRAELLRQLESYAGISKPAVMQKLGLRGGAAKTVAEASKLLPNSWTQAIDSFGSLFVKETKKRAFHLTIAGDYSGATHNLSQYSLGLVAGGRNVGYIVTNAGALETAVHELAHRVQSALPGLDALFQQLHKRRTLGMPLRQLKQLYPKMGYGLSELTREDHYIDAYFGKEYDGSALEVMTMSLDTVLARRGDYFARLLKDDRELFNLTVGILFHYAP